MCSGPAASALSELEAVVAYIEGVWGVTLVSCPAVGFNFICPLSDYFYR